MLLQWNTDDDGESDIEVLDRVEEECGELTNLNAPWLGEAVRTNTRSASCHMNAVDTKKWIKEHVRLF